MNIKKMALGNAVVLFWGELRGTQLSPRKKERLMNRFKEEFDRIGDYSLASQSVLSRMLPELAFGNEDEEESFKSRWQAMNKANTVVHFEDIDTREYIDLKNEIRNLVLNEGQDPEDVARELSHEYGFSYNDILSVAMHIGNPDMGYRTRTKEITKGAFKDWLFGPIFGTPPDPLTSFIRQSFLEGDSESRIISYLEDDAKKYYNTTDLSDKVKDVIRMHVVDMKVKLRAENKLQ